MQPMYIQCMAVREWILVIWLALFYSREFHFQGAIKIYQSRLNRVPCMPACLFMIWRAFGVPSIFVCFHFWRTVPSNSARPQHWCAFIFCLPSILVQDQYWRGLIFSALNIDYNDNGDSYRIRWATVGQLYAQVGNFFFFCDVNTVMRFYTKV